MTYVPHCPLWCWVLQGEDALFFSQRTHIYLCEPPLLSAEGEVLALGASETRWLDTLGACVARCQFQSRFVLEGRRFDPAHPEASLTPPIQCGVVARMDPLGRYFCDYHLYRHWSCSNCQGLLPQGEGGFCSEACQAENRLGEGQL